MKLGSQTGSLINHLMATGGQPTPVVGMGSTILHWTDRTPATVIAVTDKHIDVQEDTATRTDHNGMSECQDYTFAPNPSGAIHRFKWNKKSLNWGDNGLGLSLGHRERYYDFSF